jgi:predicted lipase
MNGQFTITAADVQIPLRLCTWSLKRFCALEGCEFTEMFTRLQKLSLDSVINLLRAAAEYDYVKKGEERQFTDLEICDWIDESGGLEALAQKMAEELNASIEVTGLKEKKKVTRKSPGAK